MYNRLVHVIDSGLEGYHESRRCSRDTYPESYITKYTRIRRQQANVTEHHIWTRPGAQFTKHTDSMFESPGIAFKSVCVLTSPSLTSIFSHSITLAFGVVVAGLRDHQPAESVQTVFLQYRDVYHTSASASTNQGSDKGDLILLVSSRLWTP